MYTYNKSRLLHAFRRKFTLLELQYEMVGFDYAERVFKCQQCSERLERKRDIIEMGSCLRKVFQLLIYHTLDHFRAIH